MPIRKMNERAGRRLSSSASLSNGLRWQLHLFSAEGRQGCFAHISSRSLLQKPVQVVAEQFEAALEPQMNYRYVVLDSQAWCPK